MPRKHRTHGRSHWGSNDPAGRGKRRLRYWADLHDGRGYMRHSMTIRGTAGDGWLILDRLHLEHSRDTVVPTVGQAYEMWWLPDAEERIGSGELARSTFRGYESRWRTHVESRWGSVPVSDVKVLDIQEWLKSLTTSIAELSLILLRQILEFCVMYELIPRNPASGRFRMPKKVEMAHSKDVYTLSETIAAIDAVRGTVAYIPAILCGLGSCRVGESLGARVDLGEVRRVEVRGMTVAVIDLVRQVDVSGHPMDALKTKGSERPIVIPEPWSLDVLSEPGPWLCDKGFGEPLSQITVRRWWKSSLEAAGIKPIPFRNLRNSWRTYMRWELGVDEDLLEAMMGHAGRNVGEIHYDRPRWEVFAAVVADAWARYRSSVQNESCAVGTNWDKN